MAVKEIAVKANYLIVADYMLSNVGQMFTLSELSAAVGLAKTQVDNAIFSIKNKPEYKLIIDKTKGKGFKYGLTNCEKKRDFITELFTGQIETALRVSNNILKTEW